MISAGAFKVDVAKLKADCKADTACNKVVDELAKSLESCKAEGHCANKSIFSSAEVPSLRRYDIDPEKLKNLALLAHGEAGIAFPGLQSFKQSKGSLVARSPDGSFEFLQKARPKNEREEMEFASALNRNIIEATGKRGILSGSVPKKQEGIWAIRMSPYNRNQDPVQTQVAENKVENLIDSLKTQGFSIRVFNNREIQIALTDNFQFPDKYLWSYDQ